MGCGRRCKIAAAAILLAVVHQGNANAGTSPPAMAGNPLSHLS